ncbi:hypothetical protein D9758_017536 [Tetrapyrgos nigripes]|uniref:Uncharacterized protein n=1 Tax=Tetrapyrgos nigripes TaxID=182062 RepID=A0A8H5C4U0_9AGAR|nr:hypothetical protein D9758_017536 [Tetrapyrgos nigripes]
MTFPEAFSASIAKVRNANLNIVIGRSLAVYHFVGLDGFGSYIPGYLKEAGEGGKRGVLGEIADSIGRKHRNAEETRPQTQDRYAEDEKDVKNKNVQDTEQKEETDPPKLQT